MRRSVTLVIMLCGALLLGACGEGQKVGSEKLLEFDPQDPGARLGARTPTPAETPATLAVDKQTPTPTVAPTATPAPKMFEIGLVPDSPYYEPGNRIVVRVGVTIRVTNQDGTPERAQGRSFTDKNGSFHSGMLKAGQTWTWTFDRPAFYEIIDEGLNFATATLEVSP